MTRDLVLFGDCRERLKEFDDLARMCITSPPYYGLRNYGDKDNQIGIEQTPEDYVNESGNKVLVYETKKYGIPCERKFEINQKNIIESFTSSGCI